MVDIYRPQTLAEALEIRAEHAALPFAGGTDLMVRHRRNAGVLPALSLPVLFLDQCRELSAIEVAADVVEIGAGVTLTQVAAHPGLPDILRQAVREIGGPAVRNVATLGGNICNASPAADSLPPLYALDAEVRLCSARSERVLPIQQFVTGPGRTAIRSDELLRSIRVRPWWPDVSLWRKVGTRKANALSKVSIAACADREGSGIGRVGIALGAIAPTVVRLHAVEALLRGHRAGELSERVRQICRQEFSPIDDQRSTARYRATVGENLVLGFIALFDG